MKVPKEVVNILKTSGVGILPTDTLYGIVGSALNPETVKRVYSLRRRSSLKPAIILISSLNELDHFNIKLSQEEITFLEKVWPNPVSVVLPCNDHNLDYLHRGTNSLAFRIPKPKWLREILSQTGPLIAPSANFEGERPAETVEEARKYFGGDIDFYVDKGILKGQPSTLIELKKGKVRVLREGAFKIHSS